MMSDVNWPSPPEITVDDPQADVKKILYQAQVQAAVSQQQSYASMRGAAEAHDYATQAAVYQAYLDSTKSALDRAQGRAGFIQTAAAAVSTAYCDREKPPSRVLPARVERGRVQAGAALPRGDARPGGRRRRSRRLVKRAERQYCIAVGGGVPQGAHSVVIEGYDDIREVLKFANSWGAGWGDGGHGYLPYAYFDQILNEAWAVFPEVSPRPPHDRPRKYEVSEWGAHGLTGHVLHAADVYSRQFDENVAWAFGVARDEFLDVEELFVRPEWRNKGFGRELMQAMIERADKESLQIRFWVPHADSTQATLGSFARMTAAHGLQFTQSSFRWAQWLISR